MDPNPHENSPAGQELADEQPQGPVLFSVTRKIAYISINTKMNAVNLDHARTIVDYIQQAEADDKIRVIVMKSEGDRIFSAGFDLTMFTSGITEDFLENLLKYGGAVSKALFFCKKPVIAQIQGSAIGLGAIIALSSDFRYVADRPDIFFQLPEVDINMFPATGPTAMALHVLGPVHAKEMLMTGRRIPLEEFVRWGGVTELVPPEELAQVVKKFAKSLAKKPANLVQSIKSALNMMSYDQASRWYKLENEFARQNVKILGNLEHPPIDDFIDEKWDQFTAGKGNLTE